MLVPLLHWLCNRACGDSRGNFESAACACGLSRACASLCKPLSVCANLGGSSTRVRTMARQVECAFGRSGAFSRPDLVQFGPRRISQACARAPVSLCWPVPIIKSDAIDPAVMARDVGSEAHGQRRGPGGTRDAGIQMLPASLLHGFWGDSPICKPEFCSLPTIYSLDDSALLRKHQGVFLLEIDATTRAACRVVGKYSERHGF